MEKEAEADRKSRLVQVHDMGSFNDMPPELRAVIWLEVLQLEKSKINVFECFEFGCTSVLMKLNCGIRQEVEKMFYSHGIYVFKHDLSITSGDPCARWQARWNAIPEKHQASVEVIVLSVSNAETAMVKGVTSFAELLGPSMEWLFDAHIIDDRKSWAKLAVKDFRSVRPGLPHDGSKNNWVVVVDDSSASSQSSHLCPSSEVEWALRWVLEIHFDWHSFDVGQGIEQIQALVPWVAFRLIFYSNHRNPNNSYLTHLVRRWGILNSILATTSYTPCEDVDEICARLLLEQSQGGGDIVEEPERGGGIIEELE